MGPAPRPDPGCTDAGPSCRVAALSGVAPHRPQRWTVRRQLDLSGDLEPVPVVEGQVRLLGALQVRRHALLVASLHHRLHERTADALAPTCRVRTEDGQVPMGVGRVMALHGGERGRSAAGESQADRGGHRRQDPRHLDRASPSSRPGSAHIAAPLRSLVVHTVPARVRRLSNCANARPRCRARRVGSGVTHSHTGSSWKAAPSRCPSGRHSSPVRRSHRVRRAHLVLMWKDRTGPPGLRAS